MILPTFELLSAAAHFAASAANAQAAPPQGARTDTGVLDPGWSAARVAPAAPAPEGAAAAVEAAAHRDRRLAGECSGDTVTCVDGYVEGTGQTVTCEAACGGACCVGASSCHRFTGQVCKDGISCTGSSACGYATIDSVVEGCSGYKACYGGYACYDANIGSVVEACNGVMACSYAVISPGLFDCCNTDFACRLATSLPASCPAAAPTDAPTEAPFAVVDCCAGVRKCEGNPARCKCVDDKCKKKKVNCMTKGDGMEWWGCRDGKTCVAKDNAKGKPKKWGKCLSV